MVSLRTKFWLTHDNRDRRKAGTSFRTKGSNPMLQASAIRTAQMLTARSPALESRSLIWVNFAVKSVRAAISSRISGKSARGSRAAISLRSRARLDGSSSLSGEVRTSSSLSSTFSTRANGFEERLVATDDMSDLAGGQVLAAFLQPTENGPRICKQPVERIPRLDRSTDRFVRPHIESWVK